MGASHAAELAKWDFVLSSDEAAVTSSSGSLTASSVTMAGSVYNTQDSDSGAWRTRGYSGTTDYIEFSISAGATSQLTLESLIFGAFARAANSSGGSWADPEIILEYSMDSSYSSVVQAGVLDLGPTLSEGSGEGDAFTSDASTFFGTDLVINPLETYYFRLRASNATGSNLGRNQLYYLADTDLTLNGSVASSVSGLVWTGANSANWNLAEENFSDTGAPSLFETGDDVVIETLSDIIVDAGGITAGAISATTDDNEAEYELQGGNLTTTGILKTGSSNLEIALAGTFSTGAGTTTVDEGNLEVESGATFLTSSLVLLNGAEFRVENGGSFTNSGATTVLGTDGGVFRANSGTSVSLGEISGNMANAGFTKQGSGSLTVTGPVGAFGTGPIFLDHNGGSLTFDGANTVAITGRSGEDNSVTSMFLNGTDLALHNVNMDGGVLTVQGVGTKMRTRLDDGPNLIGSDVVLSSDLIIESEFGDNDIRFSGSISGAGGLSMGSNGDGDLYLDESNSYSGTTTIDPGFFTLHATSEGTPLGSGDIVMSAGSVLSLENFSMTIPGDISGDGTILVDGSLGIFGGSLLPVKLGGDNSFYGWIFVEDGLLEIDGTSTFSSEIRGSLIVQDGGSLGGNGSSEHHVEMDAGAALSVVINDWTGGVAGTDYDDLYVHTFNAQNVAIDLRIFHDTPTAPSFDESTQSFTFLTTSPGGLTNFSPENVTILPRSGFTGTGTWSVAQVGDSLVLTYTGNAPTYQTWIAGFGLSGPDADADFDFDKDGIANVVEFALGGDPTMMDLNILPDALFDGTDYTVLYSRNEESKTATAQTIQFGTDLENWTDVLIPEAAGDYSIEGATVSVVDGDPATLPDEISVTIPGSLVTDGKFFSRLVVVEN